MEFLHQNKEYYFKIVADTPLPNTKSFTVELYLKSDFYRIGHLSVMVCTNNIVARDSYIKEDLRRIGLGTKMYDFAEQFTNKKIIPYEEFCGVKSSADAVEFWKKRSGIILQDRHFIYED